MQINKIKRDLFYCDLLHLEDAIIGIFKLLTGGKMRLQKRIPKVTKHSFDLQFKVADITTEYPRETYLISHMCNFCSEMEDEGLCDSSCPFSGGNRFTCNLEKWFKRIMKQEKVYGKNELIEFSGAETIIFAVNKKAAIALVRRARTALKKYIEWI